MYTTNSKFGAPQRRILCMGILSGGGLLLQRSLGRNLILHSQGSLHSQLLDVFTTDPSLRRDPSSFVHEASRRKESLFAVVLSSGIPDSAEARFRCRGASLPGSGLGDRFLAGWETGCSAQGCRRNSEGSSPKPIVSTP